MAKISLTLADGRVIKTAAGRSLYDISRDSQSGAQGLILAATLDQNLCPLDVVPAADARLEWITYASKSGREIYQRSASFILNMAVAELYRNTRLVIGHSISNGFYYDFYCGIPVTQDLLDGITAKMREISRRRSVVQAPGSASLRSRPLLCPMVHERQSAFDRKLGHRPGADL